MLLRNKIPGLKKIYRNRNLESYCGLVVEFPKLEGNVGTLFRAATCLGNVDFLGTIGSRYQTLHSDTIESNKSIPCFNFPTIEDFLKARPNYCQIVGVEICRRSVSLEKFEHPSRAIYILGSEDGGISPGVLKYCRHVVKLPMATGIGMNLSSCGSMVLWDRYLKMNKD